MIPSVALLDTGQLSAMAAGSPELLLPILDDFESSARESLGAIRSALAGNPEPDSRSLLHQLKGSSGSLGLIEFHELCARSEAAARQGAPLDPALPDQLEDLLESSARAARHYLQGEN